jgi:hypothetical protein
MSGHSVAPDPPCPAKKATGRKTNSGNLHQSPPTQGTRRPMPKNTVTDPITDQEIAFAHLVLSGTMTDRRAAEPLA